MWNIVSAVKVLRARNPKLESKNEFSLSSPSSPSNTAKIKTKIRFNVKIKSLGALSDEVSE